MSVNFNNISFKSYVPVRFFVKNPDSNKYYPVQNKDNIRKCNGYLVRNLNGTIKNNKNPDFISYFASFDNDYKKNPIVHSVYDKNSPVVYLVTGNDANVISNMAKPIGTAKAKSKEAFGHSKSYESTAEARTYFQKAKAYMRASCKRIKDKSKNPLTLTTYFNAKYNKNGKFVGFEYAGAKFVNEDTVAPHKNPTEGK